MKIPEGNSREEIKTRRQIIKEFYANWIAQHPDKKVWNESLKAYIYVKYQSINETAGHASLSKESTEAVLQLSEVLSRATPIGTLPRKYNDKNQKPYDKIILLKWKHCRLIVGRQKTSGMYVQYYVGSEKIKAAR